MSLAQKIKLFLIEDNSSWRKHLHLFAKKHQIDLVGEAWQTTDVLTKIKNLAPNVILLDMVIPQQDAFKLIETLKQEAPQIPLIAYSTLKEEHIVAQALQAGCFDYIVKPFEEERLLQSIEKAVA